MFRLIAVFVTLASCSVYPLVPVFANDDACAEVPLLKAHGSVSFTANFARRADSIGVVANRLLNDALSKSREVSTSCKENCSSTSYDIIYRVEPIAFIEQVKQRAECLTFESQTSVTPLHYDAPSMSSFEELNEWIGRFTRGKGREGKALYRACGSNCSPRYRFKITTIGSSYQISSSVICGLARDKSEDRYTLSTAMIGATCE